MSCEATSKRAKSHKTKFKKRNLKIRNQEAQSQRLSQHGAKRDHQAEFLVKRGLSPQISSRVLCTKSSKSASKMNMLHGVQDGMWGHFPQCNRLMLNVLSTWLSNVLATDQSARCNANLED